MAIQPGSRVTLHLQLALTNGEVVENTFGGEPMQITVGAGELVEGLELALYGMEEGQRESVLLNAVEAFGFPDQDKLHWMPRGDFNPDIALEEGMVIGFTTPAGDEVPGRLVELQAEQVLVDFNHPLAGMDVQFTAEILAVDNEPSH